MALSNCKECNKLFQKTVSDACPKCTAVRSENISKIDAFAFRNKDFTIEDIEKKTQVPQELIKKYLMEGRVPSIKTLTGKCEICGTVTTVFPNFLCQTCLSGLKGKSTRR